MMNKYLLSALLLAPSVVLVSCSKTPIARVHDDIIGHFEEMIEILEDCHAGNADAQAEKFKQKQKELTKAMAQLDEWAEKDPEALADYRMNSDAGEKMGLIMMRLDTAVGNIKSQDWYADSKLQQVLENHKK